MRCHSDPLTKTASDNRTMPVGRAHAWHRRSAWLERTAGSLKDVIARDRVREILRQGIQSQYPIAYVICEGQRYRISKLPGPEPFNALSILEPDVEANEEVNPVLPDHLEDVCREVFVPQTSFRSVRCSAPYFVRSGSFTQAAHRNCIQPESCVIRAGE